MLLPCAETEYNDCIAKLKLLKKEQPLLQRTKLKYNEGIHFLGGVSLLSLGGGGAIALATFLGATGGFGGLAIAAVSLVALPTLWVRRKLLKEKEKLSQLESCIEDEKNEKNEKEKEQKDAQIANLEQENASLQENLRSTPLSTIEEEEGKSETSFIHQQGGEDEKGIHEEARDQSANMPNEGGDFIESQKGIGSANQSSDDEWGDFVKSRFTIDPEQKKDLKPTNQSSDDELSCPYKDPEIEASLVLLSFDSKQKKEQDTSGSELQRVESPFLLGNDDGDTESIQSERTGRKARTSGAIEERSNVNAAAITATQDSKLQFLVKPVYSFPKTGIVIENYKRNRKLSETGREKRINRVRDQHQKKWLI